MGAHKDMSVEEAERLTGQPFPADLLPEHPLPIKRLRMGRDLNQVWAAVDAVERIAEGLRCEEWTQGHIEVIAAIVGEVIDVKSRNRFSEHNEERTGPNVVDGKDWGCR